MGSCVQEEVGEGKIHRDEDPVKVVMNGSGLVDREVQAREMGLAGLQVL